MPWTPLIAVPAAGIGSSITVCSPQIAGVSSEAIVAAVEVASDAMAGTVGAGAGAAAATPPRPRPRPSALPRPRVPRPSPKQGQPHCQALGRAPVMPPRPRPPRSEERSAPPLPRPLAVTEDPSVRPAIFPLSLTDFFFTWPHWAAWPAKTHINFPLQKKIGTVKIGEKGVTSRNPVRSHIEIPIDLLQRINQILRGPIGENVF